MPNDYLKEIVHEKIHRLGLVRLIDNQLKKLYKKHLSLNARKEKAEDKGRTYDVDNFERRIKEQEKDMAVLNAIKDIKEDADTKSEKKHGKTVYKNFKFFTSTRDSVRRDLYESEKALFTLPEKFEKAQGNEKKTRTLEKSQLHHERRKEASEINYAFITKIGSQELNPNNLSNLSNIDLSALRERTKLFKNAVKRQKQLQKTLEKNESMIEKREKKLADAGQIPPDNIDEYRITNHQPNVPTYVQAKRRETDSNTDYTLSNNLMKAVFNKHNANTVLLAQQFKRMNKAILQRNGYLKKIESAEERQLTLLKKSSEGKTVENLEGRLKKHQRRIDDEKKLYNFSRALITKASTADEANVVSAVNNMHKELLDLEKIQKIQSNALKKLEKSEKKQSRLKEELEKIEAFKRDARDNGNEEDALVYDNLYTTQLLTQQSKQNERKIKDENLAHDMINNLIEQSYSGNRNVKDLQKQMIDLKAGVGGRARITKKPFGQLKYRIALEKAEEKLFEIQLKEKRARTDLEKLTPEKTQEIAKLEIKQQEYLNAGLIEVLKKSNAEQDYTLGNAILEKAKTSNDPSQLPQEFETLASWARERDQFAKRLIAETQKQNEEKIKLLKEESKLQTLQETASTLSLLDGPKQDKINKKIALQTLKINNLMRINEENKKRDELRLQKAKHYHDEANRLMKIALDPNKSPAEKQQAKRDLDTLKTSAKKQADHERAISQLNIMRLRSTFRTQLEKETAPDSMPEFMYNLTNEMIKKEINYDATSPNALLTPEKVKALNNKAEALLVAGSILLEYEDKFKKTQAKNGKNEFDKELENARWGYVISELIKIESEKPTPDFEKLAENCRHIKAGIGGVNKFGKAFGLQRQAIQLDKATRLDRAHSGKPDSGKYQRRYTNASTDYTLGEDLLKKALLQDDALSINEEKIKNFKKNFKTLENLIETRNGLTKALEATEQKNANKETKTSNIQLQTAKEHHDLFNNFMETHCTSDSISDIETIEKAQNDINSAITLHQAGVEKFSKHETKLNKIKAKINKIHNSGKALSETEQEELVFLENQAERKFEISQKRCETGLALIKKAKTTGDYKALEIQLKTLETAIEKQKIFIKNIKAFEKSYIENRKSEEKAIQKSEKSLRKAEQKLEKRENKLTKAQEKLDNLLTAERPDDLVLAAKHDLLIEQQQGKVNNLSINTEALNRKIEIKKEKIQKLQETQKTQKELDQERIYNAEELYSNSKRELEDLYDDLKSGNANEAFAFSSPPSLLTNANMLEQEKKSKELEEKNAKKARAIKKEDLKKQESSFLKEEKKRTSEETKTLQTKVDTATKEQQEKEAAEKREKKEQEKAAKAAAKMTELPEEEPPPSVPPAEPQPAVPPPQKPLPALPNTATVTATNSAIARAQAAWKLERIAKKHGAKVVRGKDSQLSIQKGNQTLATFNFTKNTDNTSNMTIHFHETLPHEDTIKIAAFFAAASKDRNRADATRPPELPGVNFGTNPEALTKIEDFKRYYNDGVKQPYMTLMNQTVISTVQQPPPPEASRSRVTSLP